MTPEPDASVFLVTDRLVLRRFADTEDDARLLFELDRDPEVTRYTGPGHATVGEYRDKIRNEFVARYGTHPSRGLFGASEKSSNEFLGWFLLRPAPDYRFAVQAGWTRATDIEIGYRLKRAVWGRGLATEASRELVRLAFEDPEVTALVASALVTNRASTRVMEKIGMTRIREFAIPGYDDPSVMYALCRAGCAPP